MKSKRKDVLSNDVEKEHYSLVFHSEQKGFRLNMQPSAYAVSQCGALFTQKSPP